MRALCRARWSLPHMAPMIKARYVGACYLDTTITAATFAIETPHAPQNVAVGQDHRMSLHTRCDTVTTLPPLWTWVASNPDRRTRAVTLRASFQLTSAPFRKSTLPSYSKSSSPFDKPRLLRC